ncbi:MAG: hypothetical protein ABIN91_17410 [Mucilaginibacter sp.]|uniref:hypothetical protein n=1 Tax=Mucilaginibacter sp. TaxID=1882438 RepID=UPI003264FD73
MEDNLSIPATKASFCSSCYTKVNEADAYCDNCGYPLKGTEIEQQNFITNRNVKEIDLEDYNKKIKSAGNALYWVAIACVLSGIILYATAAVDAEQKFATLITNLILAIIFIALGVWSRKKPFAALVSGACLYAIILILNAIQNPLSIISGIIIKIIIIGAFIKGIRSAIEAEKIKKELNID